MTRADSKTLKLEASFRTLMDGAPNAMVAVDRDGALILFNSQAEQVFGYTREEVLGRPLELLVPTRFRSDHPSLRAGFGHAPNARPMGAGRDLYALRKNGSEIPVEIGLTPINTQDGLIVLAAIIDISERKQRETALCRALEEKEVLLGEIHHRVKNNLQIVDSLLEMQKGRVNDAATVAALQESQNRVRAMAIIHQMLYQSADFSEVALQNVLQRLADNVFVSYGAAPRIAFEAQMDDVTLPLDKAIPLGLFFNEVLSNACKHAFPNERTGLVRVELHTTGRTVTLSVSDDGVGLPAELPLDGGVTATLGLQIVPLLARQLSGQLVVERRNPTRFTLVFEREI